MSGQREVATHDHEETRCCTDGGVSHDFRPYTYERWTRIWTSWRCVWCHGVTCGDYGSHDPCWEIYHHSGDHLSRNGVRWPIGGTRPDVILEGAR